jgi:hypothetical protein
VPQKALSIQEPLFSHVKKLFLATRGHIVDTVAAIGDIFEGIYLAPNFTSIIRTISSILRMRRNLLTWEDVGELITHNENDKYAIGEDFVDAFLENISHWECFRGPQHIRITPLP